jgi:hypothetical protein
MKSGVKRHNAQERSQREKSLATQDDRSNVARRDCAQVVVRLQAELDD